MKPRKPDFGQNLQVPAAPLSQTDALLYGLPATPTPASVTDAKIMAIMPIDEELVEVSFTTLIRKSTFLRLKQAEFWKPGFMIKKATDKALSDFLDALPEANKTLPEEEHHRLNLKKLKSR